MIFITVSICTKLSAYIAYRELENVSFSEVLRIYEHDTHLYVHMMFVVPLRVL